MVTLLYRSACSHNERRGRDGWCVDASCTVWPIRDLTSVSGLSAIRRYLEVLIGDRTESEDELECAANLWAQTAPAGS